MSRPRRKRILKLIARVNSARHAIAGRYKESGEFAANRTLIARQKILQGRLTRLLRAYMDDADDVWPRTR